ncbi:ferrochelatase [Luminiphilus sp.]|nr:ferrochelatase [Luminiphilus sp.]MDB2312596.1 ferrochelatase [Luminiphilus sp.]
MRFIGASNYDHGTKPKIGVLLTNLGTPEAPTAKALRPYLKQFLWDPRVVEVPRLLWWMILHAFILTTRPKKSAEAYAEVWTERGSPLLYHLEDQVAGVHDTLTARLGEHVIVKGAMRYGQPSIESQVQALLGEGVQQLVVLPLYPQFGGPTTASTFDALSSELQRQRWVPDLRFVSSYHDHPAYIKAIAQSVQQHWDTHGRADKLILSYHGMPKRYLLEGDPYHCQCLKTSRLVAAELALSENDYMSTFQSRFGRDEWLKPYTDKTLQSLPDQGVKSLQIICPGFSADCLETIEEIGMENRDYFLEAGGERYEYIACLNATTDHIEVISTLVTEQLEGWTAPKYDAAAAKREAGKLGVN